MLSKPAHFLEHLLLKPSVVAKANFFFAYVPA